MVINFFGFVNQMGQEIFSVFFWHLFEQSAALIDLSVYFGVNNILVVFVNGFKIIAPDESHHFIILPGVPDVRFLCHSI
jgi:hypothetical protein